MLREDKNLAFHVMHRGRAALDQNHRGQSLGFEIELNRTNTQKVNLSLQTIYNEDRFDFAKT